MSFLPGCHRPFYRSACLRSLLLLSKDCVLSLFGSVSFASAIPRLCASASPHFNRRHYPTLRPVFTQLTHTAFCGRSGNRTRDVLHFFTAYQRLIPIRGCAPVAFDHSAILPLVHSLRKVRDSNPRAIADLLLSRELPYHSANLPCCVCRNIIAALTVTPRSLLLYTMQLQPSASAIHGTPLRQASAVSSS